MVQEGVEVELTPEELEVEKQKIRDNVENPNSEEEGEVTLPSEDNKKFANVFEDVDALKKGIQNLKADVPEYMLNGMNEEALEQYYIDLRKEFSSKPTEDKPAEDEPTEEKPTEEKPEAVPEDLWTDLAKTFAEKGGLEDKDYDALAKLGIPNTVVDDYIDGIKVKAQVFTDKVYGLAGGEEQYNEIKAWAEENYSQEKLDMIASGSHEEILMKMQAVKVEYDAKVGSSTKDRVTGDSPRGNSNGYVSQADYLRDVMSPEYRRNSKYKAKVDAKFANSSFAS